MQPSNSLENIRKGVRKSRQLSHIYPEASRQLAKSHPNCERKEAINQPAKISKQQVHNNRDVVDDFKFEGNPSENILDESRQIANENVNKAIETKEGQGIVSQFGALFKFSPSPDLPEEKPKCAAIDFLYLFLYILVIVTAFSLLGIISLLINFDFRSVYASASNHNHVISHLINGLLTADLINLMMIQTRFRLSRESSGRPVEIFGRMEKYRLPKSQKIFFLWMVFFMLVTDAGSGFLFRLSIWQTGLTQITFLLVVIALNVVQLFQLMFALFIFDSCIYPFLNQETKDSFKETSPKRPYKLFFLLGLFRTLPFCQLVCSFIGELIAPYLPDIRLLLLFCFSYPVLMGFWQKLMSVIDDKLELDLEFLGESYSLMYAVLPYKMVYLSVDDPEIVGLILGIKTFYKTVAYIIVPVYGKCKEKMLIARQKRMEEEAKAKEGDKVTADKKEDVQGESDSKQIQLKKEKEGKELVVKLGALFKQFFDDPMKGKILFMNKFLVLQINDIYVNVLVFVLLIIDSYALVYVDGESMEKPAEFIKQFGMFSGIELGMDIFFLIVYGSVIKYLLFDNNYDLSSKVKRFYTNMSSHITIACVVLFTVCYYIRYSIKFTA